MSKKAHNKFVVITIVLIILILNLALISATNNSLNNTLNLSPNHSFNSTLNLTLNVTAPTLNVSINFSLNEFNVSINGTFNEFNNFDNDTNLTLNVTAPTLNVSINETPQITVKNSDNKEEKVEIKITEEVKKKETWNGNAKIHGLAKLGDRVENESKTYSIEIVPEDSPVEKIVLYDVEVQNETLGLDDVPEDIPAPHGEWEEVYAIDPTEINFTNATVTVTATGNILYKCEKWNFEDQSCGGEWVLFKEGLIPGQEYTFTLTPDDPGFGEINATSATHLDENKTAIRSIYNSIALADDVWSESIPQEHHVRITFEKELDNGNMIDVVAASNNTYAYFEVLVAGTEDIVGRSSAFGPEELQYIEINGLDEPTDTFDFKIIKSEYNAEDNSSEIDPNEISFITFDYIHDEAITPTSAEGIIVYQEQDVPTPHYRLWNSSTNDFGSELNANSVSQDITWVVVKANHERDEVIMGTEDKGQDVNIQIFNESKSWGSLTEVSNDIPNSAYRAFDIAYEQISGDALIVYETSSVADTEIGYRTWNGTDFTTAQTITLPFVSSTVNFVSLVENKGSNNIMLIVLTSAYDVYAIPWDGNEFNLSKDGIVTTSTTSITEEHFAFAWEGVSGDGLITYSEGNDLVRRAYTHSSGIWGGEIKENLDQNLDGIRMCSDTNSDYIGLIFQDNANDVDVRMWNGTDILDNSPTGEYLTEANGVNANNFDCVWQPTGGIAHFSFNDNVDVAQINYLNFSNSGDAWSRSNLNSLYETEVFATSQIKSLRMIEHPTTNEIMVTALDTSEDISNIRWNGSAYDNISTNPVEILTEVLNGDQEGAMFDWYRYDPIPSVTGLRPLSQSFGVSSDVNINVNITDNIEIDKVILEVTYPNLTKINYSMADTNNDSNYNFSFNHTDNVGDYLVKIFANDTSIYQNINDEGATNFTIGIFDLINPEVTDNTPLGNLLFNTSDIVTIGANVTDDTNLTSVSVNITLPNSTSIIYDMANISSTYYVYNYTIPSARTQYNYTIIATDWQNNTNDSISGSFRAQDIANPQINETIPSTGSTFNVSNLIDISAIITDTSTINLTYVNITYPNSNSLILNLTHQGNNYYNNSFIAPALLGQYNISYYVLDKFGNVNDSIENYFIIQDVVNPNVSIISPLFGQTYQQNDNVTLNISVSDDINISKVYANISYPDSSNILINLTDDNSDGKYSEIFNNTVQFGTYVITFYANDTTNNLNDSETRSFLIQDSQKPISILDSPYHGEIITLRNFNITCNATDNSTLANVTLYHDVNQSWGPAETNNISGMINNTIFLIIGAEDGNYKYNCLAYDTSGNYAFASQNNSFNIDATFPNVTNVNPTQQNYGDNVSIEISAYVSDFSGLANVYANISYPDSNSSFIELLDDDGDDIYNNSFITPSIAGDYIITIIATDVNGNVNDTETGSFNISDIFDPVISNIFCIPSIGDLGDTVKCNATITDNIGIDTIIAMVIPPDNTTEIKSTSNVGDEYTFTFSKTSVAGTHLVNWTINDTANNVVSGTTTFNLSDVGLPTVVQDSPLDNHNSSTSKISFIFTASDNYYSTTNCTLYLNNVADTSRIVTNNRAETVSKVLSEGNYNWSVTSVDDSNNSQNTSTWSLLVDYSPPEFISVGVNPDNADERDPHVPLNISLNLTDSFSPIDTVIMQRKLEADRDYVDQEMIYNVGDGLYYGNFTPALGTYEIRFYANDSLDNSNYSVITTLFIEYDNTWSTINDFEPVVSTIFENVSLGNLTIINSGDFPLTIYNITSDSNETQFNETTSFDLNVGENKTISIIDESLESNGIKIITFTINTNGTPSSRNVNTRIIRAIGQPALISTITSPEDEYEVLRDGTIEVVARIQNLGESTAYNGTVIFDIPAGWDIVFGAQTNEFSELLSEQDENFTINLEVPDNATYGYYTIGVNVDGVNGSGYNISALGLTVNDNLTVEVYDPVNAGDIINTEEEDTGGSSSGGGSGSSSSRLQTVSNPKTIETEVSIWVSSGNTVNFPLEVYNPYQNAILRNISLEVDKEMEKYITYEPNSILRINSNETEFFNITFTIPPYMSKDELNIELLIYGIVTTYTYRAISNRTIAINSEYRDLRTVNLMVREVAVEEAEERLLLARNIGEEINALGFNSTRADSILKQIEIAYTSGDFDAVKVLQQSLLKIKENIVAADSTIKEVETKITEAKVKGLDVSETEKILLMAKRSFAREDYETALERAKQALLTESLETKGVFNIINFVKRFWWAIAISIILLIILSIAVYNKILFIVINQRLERLANEEIIIQRLMVELQEKTFSDKTIGMKSYHKKMYECEKRLAKIKSVSSRLRIKKLGLTDPLTELKNLNKESERIIDSMKSAQEDYFKTNKINSKKYKYLMNELKLRFAELEEAASVVKIKLAKEGLIDPNTLEIIKKPKIKGIKGIINKIKRTFLSEVNQKRLNK